MKCDNFLKKLMPLLYGEVNKKEREELIAHSMGCSKCKGIIEKYKITQEFLKSLDYQAVSSGFHERLMNSINNTIKDEEKPSLVRIGSIFSMYNLKLALVTMLLIVIGFEISELRNRWTKSAQSLVKTNAKKQYVSSGELKSQLTRENLPINAPSLISKAANECEEENVRYMATLMLADEGGEEIVPLLKKIFTNSNSDKLREAAFFSLTKVGDRTTLDFLKKEISKEPSMLWGLEAIKAIEIKESNKPWLGLAIKPNEHGEGIKVVFVYEGTPAKLAGIQEEDIIVSVDGIQLFNTNEFIEYVMLKKIGDSITVSLQRNTQLINIKLACASFPSNR